MQASTHPHLLTHPHPSPVPHLSQPIGAEAVFFYGAEIVAAFVLGRWLDKNDACFSSRSGKMVRVVVVVGGGCVLQSVCGCAKAYMCDALLAVGCVKAEPAACKWVVLDACVETNDVCKFVTVSRHQLLSSCCCSLAVAASQPCDSNCDIDCCAVPPCSCSEPWVS